MFLTTLQASLPRHAHTLSQRTLLAIALAALVASALYWLPADLSIGARLALATFAICIVAWTLTPLNDTFVALLAAIGLVLSQVIGAQGFFASIGNSVVWLMIGAFIVARALNQSGLSARITAAVTRRAQTVGQLFYLLTAVLLLTAIVIPSTSGRAALLVPIYQALTTSLASRQVTRALAIALPVNILLTAVGSLVGAGAHFVINDTLRQMNLGAFSFVEWLLMGLPFAIVSAFGSTWVILHLFLSREERRLRLDHLLPGQLTPAGAWSRQERFAALVTLALISLWATEAWHGIDNALIAVLGALALTLPGLGALTFKEAAKGVEWEMILFVAASLALSEALIVTGAGAWLVDTAMLTSGINAAAPQVAILIGVAVVTLTSHLYITSRSARGAIIAPLVVLLALSLDIAPHVLAFVTAAGIGFCITLAVSAKPLTMFQQMGGEQPTFHAGDLARLSGILGPLHVALIVVFALFYWQPLANVLHPLDPVRTTPATTTLPDTQEPVVQLEGQTTGIDYVPQPLWAALPPLSDATAQDTSRTRQPGSGVTRRPPFHTHRTSLPVEAGRQQTVVPGTSEAGADQPSGEFANAPAWRGYLVSATLRLAIDSRQGVADALNASPVVNGVFGQEHGAATVSEPSVQPPASTPTQPASAAPGGAASPPLQPPPADAQPGPAEVASPPDAHTNSAADGAEEHSDRDDQDKEQDLAVDRHNDQGNHDAGSADSDDDDSDDDDSDDNDSDDD